jgi:hypothetical protein
MSNIYSTAQAAERLGIAADTIRTWKRRQTERLLEGQHWLKDENNSLMWTDQGMQVLAQLQGSDMNCKDVQIEPASSSLLNRYEPLIDMLANALAPKLQQRLDNKVLERVQDFGQAEPLTTTECVSLLTKLGLKPANPAELLTGQNIQALPESKQ